MAVALPLPPVVQCAALDIDVAPEQALLEVVATIDSALEHGARLIDVTNISKWEFLGTILQRRRGKLSVAFRFGTPVADEGGIGDSAPARIRKTCEEALQACGLDAIDLFYQERPDATTPIDQTMAELKALVQEGKVRCVGIAADTAATIARAHAVHPVATVSLEWSLWRPRALDDVVSASRNRGIAILAKNPCGAGLMDARRVEREHVSDKMKALLEDQSHLLLERLRKLVDEPSCDLVDSLRNLVSEEADRCVKSVQEKTEVQSCELTGKIAGLATGPNVGMVKFLMDVVQDHHSRFMGKVQALMSRQSWKIMEKVGILKDACGGQCIGSLKNMLRKQKCKAIETLARLKTRQEELLLLKAEGYMLGQTEVFTAALRGFLAYQKAELVLLITDTRSRMNTAILERIRYTCAEHNTRIAAKVLTIKDKQSVLLARTTRKMIGCQGFLKSGLQALEQTLQTQKEELVQQAKLFSTMERNSVLAVVKRLLHQHNAEIIQQIDNVVEGKNSSLNSRVLEGMGECGNEAMMSSETRNLLVDISLAVSERVREVASSRGCPPRSVALAWLTHQGSDVLPIVSGEKGAKLEQDILACSMQLTQQELATLCVGTGDDRDAWNVELSSDDGMTI